MDALEHSSTPIVGSCVVEPHSFTEALRFLVDRPDVPLTLEIFEKLQIMCDACVLHNEVVCPNPHLATFRYEMPKSVVAQGKPKNLFSLPNIYGVNSHDELERWLIRNQNWSFVRTDYRLTDYGSTQWYNSTNKWRMNDFLEQGLMKPKLIDSKAEDDDLMGSAILNDLDSHDYNLNNILYLDKVAAIGEKHQLTVVFDKFSLATYHHGYERLFIAPQFDLLRKCDEHLRTRVTKSSLARYRPVYHYAPMFLHKALVDTADRRPDGILHSVREMHDEFARPYRDLMTYVMTTENQAEAERLLSEAERLLFSHADKDTPIPTVYGEQKKLLLYILKIGASILSLLFDPFRVPRAVKDILSGTEAIQNALDMLPKKERTQVYRGLNFLNHFSPERPTTENLYQELKRIFGDLAFTKDDLNRHLAES